MASRPELESAAEELDALAASSAYGERIRARARTRAVEVRRRLTEGDFRVGDRILLRIEGQLDVNDTLSVLDGVRVAVPRFRQVSLAGVLRSELEVKMRTELTDVVRNATVTVRPLVRLAVIGSVAKPGYMSVTSETTLDGLLMLAGGPGTDAALAKMTLTRADTVLMPAPALQQAIARGVTIDRLELTDGDVMTVPPKAPPLDRGAVLQIVGLILTPLLTILFVNR